MADLSLDDFTAEVTAFLAANAQLKSEQRRFVWGEGPDSAALFREPDRAQEAVEIVAAKAWRAKRYDAGLGWIGGPKMYGGRQLPHAYERRYNELEARYEVTGQKVWTSGAHYSDVGEVVCRTDPDMPKHQGLSCFVVDMHDPSIEIRPLRQMTGGANFNEVFFNETRVHQGWSASWPGDVGGQAGFDGEPAQDLRLRVQGAGAMPGGRLRRMGHLHVEWFRVGHGHRRRVR